MRPTRDLTDFVAELRRRLNLPETPEPEPTEEKKPLPPVPPPHWTEREDDREP